MRRWALAVVATVVGLAAGALAIDRWIAHTALPPLVPERSTVVLDRDGRLLRAFTIADGRWRLPVTLAEVDPRYIARLIAYEDKRFRRHAGVDPWALLRAAGQAAWHGRIISGGSTLTMQVARLLEGGGTGTLAGKLRQMRVALALERRLDKDQILSLYLALAPFGGNVEGVRAASLTWFGKDPRRLSTAEVALLVALPQAPETRRLDRFPAAARQARDRVLDRQVADGLLAADEATAAKRAPVPMARRELPLFAAHLAARLRDARPNVGVLRSTIDRDLQARLEALLAARTAAMPEALSAAAMVVDHATGEVLASVGGPDLFDARRDGFVDMTRAVRSPGSTLKPLIYGLAFEAGLAHPETLVEDVPTAFGGYVPENFDHGYRGTVSVRQALHLSLNVPAVAALDAVGPARLLARLRRAGAAPQLPAGGAPGLAVGLGGVGVSLHDLVAVYAAIARGGAAVRLRETSDPTAPSIRVLSAEAAWQVADILAGVPAPAGAGQRRLAFKTGTSYGHRDSWAIGFDGRHVVGVWLGRPDGGSAPGNLGHDVAAPLLFEAFGRLKAQSAPLPPPPDNVLTVANAALPPPLRRLRLPGTGAMPLDPGPRIAFPPDGAAVDLGLGRGLGATLALKVRDGRPPFTWLVNGAPLAVDGLARQAGWQADGPGFVAIAVIDAAGRAARTRIQVR
jgi:penicillin-binding protein 1C